MAACYKSTGVCDETFFMNTNMEIRVYRDKCISSLLNASLSRLYDIEKTLFTEANCK